MAEKRLDDYALTQGGRINSEQALLGCMMLSGDAILTVTQLGIKGEMFAEPKHEALFDEMVYLSGQSTAGIDVLLLSDHLRARGLLNRIGGEGYLHQTMQAPSSAVLADQYAQVVKSSYARRKAGAGLTEAMNDLNNGAYLEDVVGKLSATIDATNLTGSSSMPTQAFESLSEAIDILESGAGGVKTGLQTLDDFLGGLSNGTMTVIAARPGAGKTVCAGTIAENLVRRENPVPVMFYSLEIRSAMLLMRFLSSACTIDMSRLNPANPHLYADDWERITAFTPELEQMPLHIGDGAYTVENIVAQARAFARRNQHFVLMVDYIQLVDTNVNFKDNDHLRIGYVSRLLTLLALELNIPIIVLSQLNREVEGRGDKMPRISDLRGSGSLEQDASNVLLLHREDMYDRESPRAGEVDIIVAKARAGKTGTVTVAGQFHYSRFRDMA